jgi:phospholipid/cholesterol/gamma-HCH transport system substrate-binding protein
MTRRNEVLVGFVVIAGIILVVFGTIWMRGLALGREEVTVQARFNEVGQLLGGSAVKFRGVPIGRVEGIALEPTGAAVIVTLSIAGNVRLPGDPVVLVSPESLFGDWQAEVVSRSQFPLYDYASSLDPAVLPGYALPDMSRLTAVADQIARNLATISDRFEIAFTEETALNIREAIENIQEVSEQLTGLVGSQQAAIEEVARNLEQTSEAAGQAALTMQRTFAEVERAIAGGRLTNIMENVERTSTHADSLVLILVSASQDLRNAALRADSTFRQVSTLASSVERGEGTLGMLLRDTALYHTIVETNVEVQALLSDIRQNPRRYINLRIF